MVHLSTWAVVVVGLAAFLAGVFLLAWAMVSESNWSTLGSIGGIASSFTSLVALIALLDRYGVNESLWQVASVMDILLLIAAVHCMRKIFRILEYVHDH